MNLRDILADALAGPLSKYYQTDEGETHWYLQQGPCLPLFQPILEEWIQREKSKDREVGLSYHETWKAAECIRLLYPTLLDAVKAGRAPLKLNHSMDKIKAIKRIIDNKMSGLHDSDIRDFAETKFSVSRARAWDMRRLMPCIALAITPKKSKSGSVLDGTVRLLEPEKIKTSHPVVLHTRELIDPKSTLRSLAIKIYGKQLEEKIKPVQQALENAGIPASRHPMEFDPEALRKDLRDIEKWDKSTASLAMPPVMVPTLSPHGTVIRIDELRVGRDSFILRDPSPSDEPSEAGDSFIRRKD